MNYPLTAVPGRKRPGSRPGRAVPGRFAWAVVVSAFLVIGSIAGQDAEQKPSILESVGLDQKLGSHVPLDLEFTNENGERIRLGDYFGDKPVILTLVYYECPMLCTLVLNGTVRALRTLEFSAGQEFEIVTVSIDSGETSELAAGKKDEYLDIYRREGAESGWHFLTGEEESIRTLADSVGFRYAYDPETDEYAHASGIMVLTPQGQVARYFYGVEYSPRDLRLGLIEATDNRIGSPVDQVLLFCYHYDPMTGKYTFTIMSILRVAGALTLLGIVTLIVMLIRHDRKSQGVASAGV